MTSKGVIVGILRINNHCSSNDVNKAAYLWIDGKDVILSEYRYVNHEWDNMAMSQDFTVCRMYVDATFDEF